jgi:hypothetical protein
VRAEGLAADAERHVARRRRGGRGAAAQDDDPAHERRAAVARQVVRRAQVVRCTKWLHPHAVKPAGGYACTHRFWCTRAQLAAQQEGVEGRRHVRGVGDELQVERDRYSPLLSMSVPCPRW